MSKSLFQNIAISLISTVLALCVVDSALWLCVPPLERVSNESTNGWGNRIHVPVDLFQYDAYLGWSAIPSLDLEYQGIRFRHNSRGLRGPEISSEKPPGRTRVILLGDSQVYGWRVPEDQTIGANLDRDFAALGLESVNLGISGFGIDQSLLRLNREGLLFHPDFVILVIFPENDFIETNLSSFWGAEKPQFTRVDDRLCLRNFPPALASGWPDRKIIRAQMTGIGGLVRLMSPLFPHLSGFLEGREWRGNIFSPVHWHYDRFRHPELPPLCPQGTQGAGLPNERWAEIPRELIGRMRNISDQVGVPLLVLIKPWGIDSGQDPQHVLFKSLLEQLKVGLKSDKIDYLDLDPVFKGRDIPEKDLHSEMGHLSGVGNREIARVIGNWIEQKKQNR